jgi:PTH1 family peptidyl-tRNA hydrolase
MHLVVGLGNPGSQYRDNRHNVGFMVVDELLARARGSALRAKFGAELAEVTLAGKRVLLC